MLSMAMVSCYEDYIHDFAYTSVSFPYQVNTRTIVVGEGMKIEIGVALGGVSQNTRDRNVSFILNNSLVTPAILSAMKTGTAYIKESVLSVTTLLPIPANYYTLSDNSKMVIKSGQHMGSIVLKADSTSFLADPATLMASYAIPLYITEADADSILEPKRYSVIGLKYENMLFGNYWHGGVTTIKDVAGTTLQTIKYYTTIPVPDNKIWKLTTVAPMALTINGYSDQTTGKAEMRITLNGGNVTVNSVTGSTKVIIPDGTSSYNQATKLQDRKIILSYKYANLDGTTSYAQDTLTFRNRLRDGVNEWQN